jgi:hypothetical protein
VVLAGLAVVVAAGAVVLWPRLPSRITRENFDRLKKGMSRAEVEAILGPPGDCRTGRGEIEIPYPQGNGLHCFVDDEADELPTTWWDEIEWPRRRRTNGFWTGDSIHIEITLDESVAW